MTLATVKLALLPSVAFEHRQDLPAVAALYFVLNAQRDIVYIGETGNLQMRWIGKRHQRAAQMQAGGYRIHWRCLPNDAAQRKIEEREAIEYFRPLWNRTEVPEDELKEISAYIRRVARHMGMDAQDLHRHILSDWCYNRKMGEE